MAQKFNLLIIFTDTASHLHSFLAPVLVDPSFRDSKVNDQDFLRPYFHLPYTKVNPADFGNPKVGQLAFYFQGRPIWKSFILASQDSLNSTQSSLLLFATRKLTGFWNPDLLSSQLLLMELNHRNAVVTALLGVRAGLFVSPFSHLARDIVARNMATVIAVDADRSAVLVEYISEPVLADAATFLLASNDCELWAKCLEVVGKMFSSGLISTGEIGEFVARVILSLVRDHIRWTNMGDKNNFGCLDDSFFSPAADILKVFEPKFTYPQNWLVNFNHFIHMHSDVTLTNDVLRGFWNCCCAIVFVRNNPYWDLLIPVAKFGKSGIEELSYMLVQVKNFKSRKVFDQKPQNPAIDTELICNELHAAYLETLTGGAVPPQFCLYMDVGNTGVEIQSQKIEKIITIDTNKAATKSNTVVVEENVVLAAIKDPYTYLEKSLPSNFAGVITNSLRNLATTYQHPIHWFENADEFNDLVRQVPLSYEGKIKGSAAVQLKKLKDQQKKRKASEPPFGIPPPSKK
jgi:hypothetical protein